MKSELEVRDNSVDNFVIFDKGDDFHLSAALRAEERINFIDFFYHLRPASMRHKWSLIFNDWRAGRVHSCLAHLSPASAGAGPCGRWSIGRNNAV